MLWKYFMAVPLKLLQALLCYIDESFCISPRQVQRQMEREKGRNGGQERKAAEGERLRQEREQTYARKFPLLCQLYMPHRKMLCAFIRAAIKALHKHVRTESLWVCLSLSMSLCLPACLLVCPFVCPSVSASFACLCLGLP